jgi:drug/metabolite transporter (DMT)-like permease
MVSDRDGESGLSAINGDFARKESARTAAAAGTASILAACLLWGFNYIPITLALREVAPLVLLLLRLVVCAPMYLVVFVLRKESFRSLRPYLARGVWLALLAVVGDQLLFLFALKYTTPSHAGVMYSIVPVFTAILAFLFIGERVKRLRVLGIAIAFVGALILATEDGISFESRYLLGDVLMLFAALSWSIYIVVSKPVVESLGTTGTLTLVFLLGLPLALPLTIFPAISQDWAGVSPLGCWSIAYMVFAGTFAAYMFYQAALKRLPASVVAPFSYTAPVSATVFSVLLLEEVLSPLFFIAALLIFSGLVIIHKAR